MDKVLIVDDSATMRGILARVLRQADVAMGEFLEAGSGAEALEALERHDDVAVVLTDVCMPGMDGVELVRAVRARRAKDALPVVMVTTERSRALAESALAHGANAIVFKPFTPETIRAALAPYVDASTQAGTRAAHGAGSGRRPSER